MRRIVSAGLMFTLLAGLAHAQKRRTPFGDAWTGQVVTADEATREITLKADDKTKNETFAGVLEEGYKVKLKDGGQRELKISELTPGMRVRVFYKSKERVAGGQKAKVLSINKIDFLGIDEYTRLRDALKLGGSIPVAPAESGGLPAADPLKIHLAVVQPYVREGFVEWVSKWNKKEAAKHGAIELVPDAAAADISLVTFWGGDEDIMLFPYQIGDASDRHLGGIFFSTLHIVAKDAGGLKVLWQKGLILPSERPPHYEGFFEREIEKRMKARSKK